ncbi:MAG: class I SAM-dependent methyltransferase [Bacteroidales bacterium]|jgi:hypothetical protein|nr:class I SAM-dependent methyltransferase [Bacteroidales bacterium]
MKSFLLKANSLFKNFVLFLRPHILFGWTKSFLLLIAYTLYVSKWITTQNKTLKFNDFFTFKRVYSKRELLYEHVIKQQNLENEIIDYLEFGVSKGTSFRWWLRRLTNDGNKFYGFDTFEGLPENWGTVYVKGDMSADIPIVDDNRSTFIKGLFQDTLFDFLKSDYLSKDRRKIIHLDADIFSATLFVLTSLYPYLNAGDILFFDEFNVPKHEFLAFKIFTESYYVKYETLGSVNNYLQVAFILK